jgi:hypothetical protein
MGQVPTKYHMKVSDASRHGACNGHLAISHGRYRKPRDSRDMNMAESVGPPSHPLQVNMKTFSMSWLTLLSVDVGGWKDDLRY